MVATGFFAQCELIMDKALVYGLLTHLYYQLRQMVKFDVNTL